MVSFTARTRRTQPMCRLYRDDMTWFDHVREFVADLWRIMR